MARPLRINIPDGWYHVMSRGLEKRLIFEDARDQSPQDAYRHDVEDPLKAGVKEMLTFGERIRSAVALGSEGFLDRLRRGVRGNRSTQPAVRAWQRLLPFERVMNCVADAKGEAWIKFCNRRGDWGRDVALCLGRRHCGLTLQELGKAAGGMRVGAVAMAVRRIERRLLQDRTLAQQVRMMERSMCNVQT